jgi:thiol-disulfide isomerase/thioredoxin
MDRSRVARLLVVIALLGSAALVLILAQQQRALAKAYAQLRLTSVVVRPGDFVPGFNGRTTAGDSIVVGEGPPSSRQLVFIVSKGCPFCRRTLPSWKLLAATLARDSNPGVQVVAIAIDSTRATAEYLRTSGITVPVTEFPSHKVRRLFRAVVVPQTLIVDDSGRVLYSRPGVIEGAAATDSVFQAAIRPLPSPSRSGQPTDSGLLARGASRP